MTSHSDSPARVDDLHVPEDGAAPAVIGCVHWPTTVTGDGLVLAHGAGRDLTSPLLVAVATSLAAAGWLVLRLNLPFRAARAAGPPRPADAGRDRAGLVRAVTVLRGLGVRRVVLGGHSYGGRQASHVAAETPGAADGLLLLAFPLHPPTRPRDLRSAHFPAITTPAFFAHGTRDPFGSPLELATAVDALGTPAARRKLHVVDGAAHDLLPRRRSGGAVGASALRAEPVTAAFLPWWAALGS